MAPDVFSVPVFLVVFRETIETAVIVSILLAFLKQTLLSGTEQDLVVYKKLRRQVWLGTGIGFFICMVVAGALIGVFYKYGNQAWEENEHIYEGVFSLIACIIITIMGVALLRVGKMQAKWRFKLAKALESPVRVKGSGGTFKRFCEKYAMFVLPFVTILREGVEAIVFVAGVSFSTPAKSVPLAVVVGIAVGSFVGWLLYKGGSTAKLQFFLVISTCVLYVVAAGLATRTVWYFEQKEWNDKIGGEAAELGNGPGSYDISKSVWHINCCDPNVDKSWGILNALVGWTNSATYGTVISYNVYWIFVMCMFGVLRFNEVKGHWPFMKPKATDAAPDNASNNSGSGSDGMFNKKVATATASRA